MKGGKTMNLEIHKPELVQRVQAQIQTGHFHDTDELIEKALDALDEMAATPAVMPQGSLHDFFMNSPLRVANLDLERVADYPRAFDAGRDRTRDFAQGDGKRRRDLQRWFDEDLPALFVGRILAFDARVASCWASLTALLLDKGRPLPILDSQIAATALER